MPNELPEPVAMIVQADEVNILGELTHQRDIDYFQDDIESLPVGMNLYTSDQLVAAVAKAQRDQWMDLNGGVSEMAQRIAELEAEVEQLTRERQAYKDAAEYTAKERDALRVENTALAMQAAHDAPTIEALNDRVMRQESQLAAAQADSKRYRFLAEKCRSTSEHWGGRWSIIVDGPAPKTHDSEDDLDAAIDAAMRGGEGT